MGDKEPLLAGARVLDLCEGTGDAVTRLLADLGADVLKIEPPEGSDARHALPMIDGVSIPFALHNANKRGTVLDPTNEADRRLFFELAGGADIVVDSGIPGQAAAFGASCAQLADRFEQLVAMSVTDFGLDGPYASWHATDPVLYAMSTALSRSGPATGMPVLPPDGIASTTAAVQAAWAVLVAYFNRLRCGAGDYIDFSRFDAVVLALDPPFGTQGQAATARNAASRWRGRPRYQDAYPIFACRDGYVRICVLAPRQWRGLRAWLGEPADFQDPIFDSIAARTEAFGQLGVLIAEFFAGQSMAQLVADGQAHGVPIAAVLAPAEALQSEHLTDVGALTDTELAPGVCARVPVGYWVVDGAHAGYRTPAPAVGSSDVEWRTTSFAPTPTRPVGEPPLDGIRVIDLGVIVAGGELSRLFADLGAEVIKVESSTYPDGLRQKRDDQAISDSFARAHRNNLGLGLELRTPAGAELFARLVGASDAVFANFKPGTLPALGFSYERLQELNPGLVLAESSAFGDTGPWSRHMGYGPLVRATIGVTRMWTSDQGASQDARHPFYDAITIFPDHVVGRISAIGALAGLISRHRTGAGARIHVSQAEAVINQLDTLYVTQAAEVYGVGDVLGDPTVHRILACAGEDEWCVASLRSESDRRGIATAIGEGAGDLDAAVTSWAAERSPAEVAEALQAAGVPAGPMNRAEDVLEHPQLRLRNVFSDMAHPLFEHPLVTEAGPAPYRNIPPAAQNPAPLPGADSRRVCRVVLDMDDAEIDSLIADGVLFTAGDSERTGART
ncbi:CaiB/BaiF CoA transferase family protein [Candidatus Mycolicibacterium alkanivorans]|uniref:CoA transferase n=1 Tax=Candidatus Mycolicibacterium alkanivorans TaxID=2954114 RepID=A0ABS9YWT8_9MYCO|nr:CoA transferase [Candidatus Mycolicibacterium alkanivorans]MCI4675715.1 CoA transferase [Candidatus Mycolicibacterium alkanivorans]